MTTTTTTERPAEFFDKAGRTIKARTAHDVKMSIDAIAASSTLGPYIVKARGGDGVGTLGLYLEVLSIGSGDKPWRHTRYFVYGNKVYASSRPVGTTKANWKFRVVESPRKALEMIDRIVDDTKTVVYGRPVLVEMKADDISAIESGQIPGARFRGQHRVERDFGKYDFGSEVRSEFTSVSESIPPRLSKLLGHTV